MGFNYIIIPSIFCQLPPSTYVHICYIEEFKIYFLNQENFHHKKINKNFFFGKRNEKDDDSYDGTNDETKQPTTIFQFKSV